jgi:hypothetical protein
MSKIALTPNASGTGTFTIAAPDSNTNRTLTLPDEAGEVLTDARLASQAEAQAGTDNTRLMTPLRTREAIPAALNASGSAPIYACRAWVNFNGTTSPATIRASGNVSSVTRNATGDYTINFATALPDGDYCLAGSGQIDEVSSDANRGTVGVRRDTNQINSGAVRISTGNASASGALNLVRVFVAIFR